MDTTTTPPENSTYRQLAVWGLLAVIIAALAVFTLVTRDTEHREKVQQETRLCQLDAVRGGATLGEAELLCGKV